MAGKGQNGTGHISNTGTEHKYPVGHAHHPLTNSPGPGFSMPMAIPHAFPRDTDSPVEMVPLNSPASMGSVTSVSDDESVLGTSPVSDLAYSLPGSPTYSEADQERTRAHAASPTQWGLSSDDDLHREHKERKRHYSDSDDRDANTARQEADFPWEPDDRSAAAGAGAAAPASPAPSGLQRSLLRIARAPGAGFDAVWDEAIVHFRVAEAKETAMPFGEVNEHVIASLLAENKAESKEEVKAEEAAETSRSRLRTLLAPEIHAAFIERRLPKEMQDAAWKRLDEAYFKRQKYVEFEIKRLQHELKLDEKKSLMELIVYLLERRSEHLMYRQLLTQLMTVLQMRERAEAELDRYCLQESTYRAFVTYQIARQSHLTVSTTPSKTSSLDVLAEATGRGIAVAVWQPGERGSSLELVHYFKSSTASDEVHTHHLLLSQDQRTYQRLVMVEPQATASPAAAMTAPVTPSPTALIPRPERHVVLHQAYQKKQFQLAPQTWGAMRWQARYFYSAIDMMVQALMEHHPARSDLFSVLLGTEEVLAITHRERTHRNVELQSSLQKSLLDLHINAYQRIKSEEQRRYQAMVIERYYPAVIKPLRERLAVIQQAIDAANVALGNIVSAFNQSRHYQQVQEQNALASDSVRELREQLNQVKQAEHKAASPEQEAAPHPYEAIIYAHMASVGRQVSERYRAALLTHKPEYEHYLRRWEEATQRKEACLAAIRQKEQQLKKLQDYQDKAPDYEWEIFQGRWRVRNDGTAKPRTKKDDDAKYDGMVDASKTRFELFEQSAAEAKVDRRRLPRLLQRERQVMLRHLRETMEQEAEHHLEGLRGQLLEPRAPLSQIAERGGEHVAQAQDNYADSHREHLRQHLQERIDDFFKQGVAHEFEQDGKLTVFCQALGEQTITQQRKKVVLSQQEARQSLLKEEQALSEDDRREEIFVSGAQTSLNIHRDQWPLSLMGQETQVVVRELLATTISEQPQSKIAEPHTGNTLLHVAMLLYRLAKPIERQVASLFVRDLLRHGASVCVRNKQGETVLQQLTEASIGSQEDWHIAQWVFETMPVLSQTCLAVCTTLASYCEGKVRALAEQTTSPAAERERLRKVYEMMPLLHEAYERSCDTRVVSMLKRYAESDRQERSTSARQALYVIATALGKQIAERQLLVLGPSAELQLSWSRAECATLRARHAQVSRECAVLRQGAAEKERESKEKDRMIAAKDRESKEKDRMMAAKDQESKEKDQMIAAKDQTIEYLQQQMLAIKKQLGEEKERHRSGQTQQDHLSVHDESKRYRGKEKDGAEPDPRSDGVSESTAGAGAAASLQQRAPRRNSVFEEEARARIASGQAASAAAAGAHPGSVEAVLNPSLPLPQPASG